MFSYASDIEPHVVFMAVCIAVVVLTVPLWFLTYRRLRAAAATTGAEGGVQAAAAEGAGASASDDVSIPDASRQPAQQEASTQ